MLLELRRMELAEFSGDNNVNPLKASVDEVWYICRYVVVYVDVNERLGEGDGGSNAGDSVAWVQYTSQICFAEGIGC